MGDASYKSLTANERLVPESEVKKPKARMQKLERALGKKSPQVDVLERAADFARERN